MGDTDVPAPAGRANSPSLHLFVLSRPSTSCMRPTLMGEDISFTQSTDSNAHLFQRRPHRHAQNGLVPAIAASPCSPAKLTQKINHPSGLNYKHLLPTVLEARSWRSGCQRGRVQGEPFAWLWMLPSFCVLIRRRGLWSLCPLTRALIPPWGPHPCDLIYP